MKSFFTWRSVCYGLTIAVGLIAADALWRHTVNRVSLNDILAAEKTEIATLIERAARQRDSAELLAAAMASDRPEISDAACRFVENEMKQWRELPAEEAEPKLAALAEALAKHSAQFTPTAARDAAEFAAQLVLWPQSHDVQKRLAMIQNCIVVLRTATREGPQRSVEETPNIAAALVAAPRFLQQPARLSAVDVYRPSTEAVDVAPRPTVAVDLAVKEEANADDESNDQTTSAPARSNNPASTFAIRGVKTAPADVMAPAALDAQPMSPAAVDPAERRQLIERLTREPRNTLR